MKTQGRAIWTVSLVWTLCSGQGAWAGPPTDQLREGIDRVVEIIKGRQLKTDEMAGERWAAISSATDEIFDFAETAKRSLGQHWARRTPAEREEFVRLFTELIQRTYVSRVDQYNSEMTFQGDTVDGDHAIARTKLLLRRRGAMSLDYLMHRPRDRWQVYDVNVDGISLVANYRAQFNRIIRTESYDVLVTTLRSRQAHFSALATAGSGEGSGGDR